MESPGPYPESPMDDVDVIYHCKGCGEILEEGKAFELAGNRWHIDCFRCNTCGTLLDSDANLLLLGDGSLICNNCTYSCNACGNKIEDLAILTGDQAFCASCFRCRNCKRKIENLRYARTSQGIFCMSCHESLMARRRKKSKANRQQAPEKQTQPPIVLDKSLPALPPSALPQTTSFPSDLETPPEVETPPNASPRSHHKPSRDHPASLRQESSPGTHDDHEEPQMLPSTTYREKRRSAMPPRSKRDTTGDMFADIPFALDPNPAPGPSPLADSRAYDNGRGEQRDYFNGGKPGTAHRDLLKDSASRSSSTERRSKSTSSPHIAYQDRGRVPSSERISRRETTSSANASPQIGSDRPTRPAHSNSTPAPPSLGEGFKLQEVPKSKKNGSRSTSNADVRSPDGHSLSSAITSPVSDVSNYTPGSQDYERGDMHPLATPFGGKVERPKRGDSLAASQTMQQRKEQTAPPSPSTPTGPKHERKASASSALQNRDINTLAQLNGGLSISKPTESPTSRSVMDPPPRSAGRVAQPGGKDSSDSFTAPRSAPAPPPHSSGHKTAESISTISESSHPMSPVLRYSTGGDFTVDEDMARIFRDNEGEKDPNVLRRVSNAVKHGRSFSDRGSRSSQSNKWKSPLNGSVDISSPTSGSPEQHDDPVWLRNQLRHAQQRISELESEKSGLQERSSDIRQVNNELRDKRSTIAVLDTQREMVMRELDIMTDHLKNAKESGRAMDLNSFKSSFLKDFAASLEGFKAKIGNEIEELIQQRNEVNEDIKNLIMMKDKGYMEFESLSSKNSQLAELNNQLVHNIQDLYKANRVPGGSFEIQRSANGLGIYTNHHAKEKSDITISEIQKAVQNENSMQNLVPDQEEPTVLAAPKVVDIRKTKANKFNWKKGGQAVAKNVTKGLKGAFSAPQNEREGGGGGGAQFTIGGAPYGALPSSQQQPTAISGPKQINNPGGFGFFGGGQKVGGPRGPEQPTKPTHIPNNSTANISAAEGLFGSDLSERCEFEKSTIPSIVRRCIQEVELRGVDVEGIYRKSGGSGQVNQVKNGFEKEAEYDISDPDLDIHAVTSALKQYFRRLPNPLITFGVYDELLAAGQQPDLDIKIVTMRHAIDNLPIHHRDCLEFLVFHLARVMAHEGDNKMTSLNLAVVFAPTIMRPESIEREMTDMGPQRNAIQALLEHNKTIFAPELDPVQV
ncbi:uncharacterized protein K452DRAFT_312890 [Aplosporella prunicola CBS 121167]|uniref:RhoGAP-domain-containing protein n=1 Tax=Aplosporella prunicola CBS 121167 TaxID=1176127 RepID=A0A6A6B182_9PEZI|nr:uncharacterized protein K452DRAFT_312890 [Aplosporella prunicola CBS 121167]KAF2136777.1 hypothetical protein K452DRAFT_312890 [Aplosporella prunicola CBS 121167]